MAAASLDSVKTQLNKIAGEHGYTCVPVSWEDATRGTTTTCGLSAMGPNISDVRLVEKGGRTLFVLRTDNMNERIGLVHIKDVTLAVGNHVPAGSDNRGLWNMSLAEYLCNAKQYAGYAGLKTDALSDNAPDELCSVRFMTVWLPVDAPNKPPRQQQQPQGEEEEENNNRNPNENDDGEDESHLAGTVEFCTEIFNYSSDMFNPANAILLSTAQGTSFSTDGHNGPQKKYLHQLDAAGNVYNYWLSAERTRFQVGKEQVETNRDIAEAEARGVATARNIGIPQLGKRMNVLMTIQVPLQIDYTDEGERRVAYFKMLAAIQNANGELVKKRVTRITTSKTGKHGSAKQWEEQVPASEDDAKIGVSNAARISRGSRVDGGCVPPILIRADMERDYEQRVTVSIVIFNTVVGGVPSEADVLAAIADLNNLYKACSVDTRRSEAAASVVNMPLKEGHVAVAEAKLDAAQPAISGDNKAQ